MEGKSFTLEVISPEKVLFSGRVHLVTLPGEKGAFTILYNHAPLISTLVQGTIRVLDDTEHTIDIKSGFVEVRANSVIVCVELK
ncbi:MAG: ATP synthase F1 subunit epsilon [Bacteroidaceae bacterium]|nr:ATP synthase F1 subunit epsilon [Bacteroidaceae bacterium]